MKMGQRIRIWPEKGVQIQAGGTQDVKHRWHLGFSGCPSVAETGLSHSCVITANQDEH